MWQDSQEPDSEDHLDESYWLEVSNVDIITVFSHWFNTFLIGLMFFHIDLTDVRNDLMFSLAFNAKIEYRYLGLEMR